jgi:hypothetical protein
MKEGSSLLWVKYNCNIYGAKLSVTISEFVQCKYGKNIQQVGMETFVIVTESWY